MRTLPLIVLTTVLTLSTASAQQQKRRVAVMNFDYSTVQSYVSSIFGSNMDVGKGVSDMLVEKLVKGGQFSVIERKAIDKIMAEQNFSNSDRADATTAAKIGKLLGVEYIVLGSITQFGRDDHQTNVGGGALGKFGSKYGLGGVGVKNSKAVVGLTARLVNTDTGEIIMVANGRGESTRSGTGLLGAGGASGTAVGGMVDMTSSNFANTILGEACNSAVQTLTNQLAQQSSTLPVKTVVVSGLIADVSGNTLVLNIGSKAGVRVGDRLQVKRVGREIRDPASGKVIRRTEETLGEVAITEVDELSAVGKFSGAGEPKVGDAARTPGQ